MDITLILLAATVAVPIFGSFLIPAVEAIFEGKGKYLALALGAVTVLSASWLLGLVYSGETALLSMDLPLGLGLYLNADLLAAFMAVTSSAVSLVIILYSQSYIEPYRHKGEYYHMVLLFLGSMMGLVFSSNLVWLFVFWEMTAICSWRLVGFFRAETDIIKANKTFLTTVFGALCLLLGVIIIYVNNGTVNLLELQGATIPNTAIFLILLGIFSKSATLPFSTWLPDAGVAPSPVTALLHAAVLVKIGVYAYARIFCATIQLDPTWIAAIIFVAGASTLISAGAALIETNIKRIIAYSTISQIGFIFLGLATQNKIGVAGALLYIMMHGVAKGGLFLCAGIIEHKTHTKDITKMGGLFRTMPITGISFAFCALSVMGIPPFGGFFSKFMVIRGAAALGDPVVMTMYVLGAVMTIVYLLRVFYAVFLGPEKPVEDDGHEAPATMLVSVAILGALSLILGLLIYYPASYVNVLCSQIGVMLP